MLAALGEWHEQGRHWHRLTLTGKDSTTTITGAIDVREVGLDPTSGCASMPIASTTRRRLPRIRWGPSKTAFSGDFPPPIKGGLSKMALQPIFRHQCTRVGMRIHCPCQALRGACPQRGFPQEDMRHLT